MRRMAGTLAALAAAGTIAGCGSSGSTDSGQLAAFTQAAAATQRAGTAHVSMLMTMEASIIPGGRLQMSGDGVEDIAHRRARFSFDMSSVAALAGRDASQFRGEEIVADNVVYMHFPFLEQALGKPWAKLDLKKVSGAAGLDVTQLTQGQGDPTQLLQYLRKVAVDVHQVGTDAVRGTPTTHYSAKMDFAKLAGLLPAGQRQAAEAAIGKLKQVLGTTQIPVDLWVDAQHRVRRMVLDMNMKPQTGSAAGQSIRATVDVQLYDYGTSVDVTPPPASATADLSTAAASGLNGLASP